MPPISKRNFVLHIANGVLIALSETMTDVSLIMTALVSQLTASSVLIGLLAPLRDTGWFLPQLFISNLVERVPRKVVFYQVATVFRVCGWIALATCLWLIEDRTTLLWAFFACTVVIALSGGIGGLSYLTVTAKVIPSGQRGRLFGLREFIGGGLSIFIGGLSALILSGRIGNLHDSFPKNFALLFAVSTIFFALGCIAFCLLIEAPDVVPSRRTSLTEQLSRAAFALKTDATFRRYIFTRIALLFARTGLPFITVYAKRVMGVSDAFIGSMVSVTLGSSLFAGLIWGRLNDRRGSRPVLIAACLLGVAQCVLGVLLLPTHSVGLLVASFIVGGVSGAGLNVSLVPLLLDVVPPDQRPLYIGLSNTTLGIVMLLTSLVGLIVDYAGFAACFIFCALCFVLALERILKMQAR